MRDLFKHLAGNRIWEIIHPDEIREADIAVDCVEELRRKWGTEVGQLWAAGLNLLKIGDSTNESFVADLWRESDRRFRMIWSDPPYGVSYSDKNEYLNATRSR